VHASLHREFIRRSFGVQPLEGNVSHVIDDHDWRLEGQELALRTTLRGAQLSLTVWSAHDARDHDHCEFCWARISNRPRAKYEYDRGYATADKQRWICEPCFADFRNRFALTASTTPAA
jgi:hypothetical protein